MAYWGADRKQQTIEFRCPKAAGQEVWYSVLKEHLGLAHMTRRGIHKAFIDVMISVIAFLAGTLAQVRMKNRLQQAA